MTGKRKKPAKDSGALVADRDEQTASALLDGRPAPVFLRAREVALERLGAMSASEALALAGLIRGVIENPASRGQSEALDILAREIGAWASMRARAAENAGADGMDRAYHKERSAGGKARVKQRQEESERLDSAVLRIYRDENLGAPSAQGTWDWISGKLYKEHSDDMDVPKRKPHAVRDSLVRLKRKGLI
jgi:hypothetical protein